MTTLTDLKTELAENSQWTFIVFIRNGRAITSPKRFDGQKKVERYLTSRLRDIDRMATPRSWCRTGRNKYMWKNFSHALAVPSNG